MTRPAQSPEFATDDVYDAGGEAWDGLPNKVAEAAELAAEGYEPTQKLPAQHLNFRLWLLGQWAAFLSNVAIANWQRCPVVDTDGTTDLWGANDMDLRCGVWVSAMSGGTLCLFGEVDSASSNQLVAMSAGGGPWLKPAEVLDTTSPATLILGCCHDKTNALVVACGSAGLVYTRPAATDAGSGTWSQRNSVANHELRKVVHGAGASGTVRLIAVGEDTSDDNGVIYSSADGVTWTLRLENTDKPFRSVALKPGALWVAVGGGNAGETVGGIYSSTDGVTWTDRSAGLTTTSGLTDVVYDSRSALFFAVGKAGGRATSADGIVWTDVTDTGVAWLTADATGCATDDDGTILVVAVATAGQSAYASTDGGLTFTDGHQIKHGTIDVIRGVLWGGPWAWVIPTDIGVGTGLPAIFHSLGL